MSTHRMYVCDRCRFSHYHPLTFCPKCPGRLRLVKQQIPHPPSFKTEEDLRNHLTQQGLAYFGEYPKFPTPEPEKTMTETTINTTFQTSFGKFAACDKATYKKLKKINHLLHQVIRPWADRWARAQRRQPHNRQFRLFNPATGRRDRRVAVQDHWVFSPFWTVTRRTGTREFYNTKTWKFESVQETFSVHSPTDLLTAFQHDRQNAGHPVAEPSQVQPMKLTTAQIDQLLTDIEAFAAKMGGV